MSLPLKSETLLLSLEKLKDLKGYVSACNHDSETSRKDDAVFV
jgi:hypothetical protein